MVGDLWFSKFCGIDSESVKMTILLHFSLFVSKVSFVSFSAVIIAFVSTSNLEHRTSHGLDSSLCVLSEYSIRTP